MAKGVKTQKVRYYLNTTNRAASDIASMVGCSARYVTEVRRKMRLPSERETLKSRLSRIEQDMRDLRAQLKSIARQDDLATVNGSSELPRVNLCVSRNSAVSGR